MTITTALQSIRSRAYQKRPRSDVSDMTAWGQGLQPEHQKHAADARTTSRNGEDWKQLRSHD